MTTLPPFMPPFSPGNPNDTQPLVGASRPTDTFVGAPLTVVQSTRTPPASAAPTRAPLSNAAASPPTVRAVD